MAEPVDGWIRDTSKDALGFCHKRPSGILREGVGGVRTQGHCMQGKVHSINIPVTELPRGVSQKLGRCASQPLKK